jgi:hypothetical protein
MFRFLAVLFVIGAFVGALYFSGNALEAWESPKQGPVAMPKLPKPKKHPQPERNTHPVKSASHAKPSWLVELNAVCRRGKRQSDAIPPAYAPQEIPGIIKRVIRLNVRMNRETAALVSRSGNAAAAARLRSLYAQDEAQLQRILSAAQQRRYERLPALSRSLVALARAENGVFARLGATGCTVSPDELQL